MIYLEGNIWSIHPMAVGAAREAVQSLRLGEVTQRPKPVESVLQALPTEALPMELIDGTAVVPISGIIVDWLSYYYTSHTVLQQTFRHLTEQQPQNGVVLLIDSPGGMSKGSAQGIDALNELQAAGVKVTAQVRGGCFSAAYKYASQCQGGIYVHRTDEVGSIGTKLVMEDYSRRFQDLGIEVVPFTNQGATLKTMGDFGLPITREQRTFMDKHVNEVFQDFRRCVVEGRNLSDEQFTEVSTGAWWLPDEAQQLGLIDGVRTFEATLAAQQPTNDSTTLFSQKETAMADETKTDAGDETPKTEAKTESGTDAPNTEAKTESAKTKPTTENNTADVTELQKWVTTFGAENGTTWFLEADCDYTQALERHAAAVTKERDEAKEALETNSTLLKQVSEKLGELDPLNLESKEASEEEAGSTSTKGRTVAEIMAMNKK